jgi:hypothetical protein
VVESDHLILLDENQSVYQAGIRKEDLTLADPPVYIYDGKKWVLSSNTTSEFLIAALSYEAVFTFEYNPEEFYSFTKDDVSTLQSRLTKLPYKLSKWFGEISFYSNAPDNLVFVLDAGDQIDVLYGAASEESYVKLLAAIEGIGEPL